MAKSQVLESGRIKNIRGLRVSQYDFEVTNHYSVPMNDKKTSFIKCLWFCLLRFLTFGVVIG